MSPLRRPDLWRELLARRLHSGESVVFIARGRSMRPLWPDGTRVTVCPLEGRRVRCGEVVLVRTLDHWVLHRVVVATRRRVWLRGERDAGLVSVPRAFVLGRVAEPQGYLGRLPPRARQWLRWGLNWAWAAVRRVHVNPGAPAA